MGNDLSVSLRLTAPLRGEPFPLRRGIDPSGPSGQLPLHKGAFALLEMLGEGVPVVAEVGAAAFEGGGAGGQSLVVFFGEAAARLAVAGAVGFDHGLIALLRAVDGVVPGQVDLVLCLPAHALQTLGLMAEFCEQLRHGFGVFLDQETVFAVRDILRGAAAAHEDARELAGGCLTHDEAVGVERRREKEQVCAAVPGADDVAVILWRGEEHAVGQAEGFGIGDDLVMIPAAADEDHAERVPRVLELFERVQRDAQALVPHHAADEKEDRHAPRQVEASAGLLHQRVRHAAAGKVDAVRHDAPVALVAETAQVLARAAADRPDLVEGADIVDEKLFCALLQELGVDGVGDVDIEFRVIGKDRRHMDAAAQLAREDGGGDRAVAVDEVERILHERFHRLFRERKARVVADELRHVDARVAHDWEAECAVIRAGIGGRGHDGRAAAFGDDPGVIDDRIGHAVGHGREGIVDEADGSVGHGRSPLCLKRRWVDAFPYEGKVARQKP